MARINTYPKLSTVNPSDLLVVTDVTSSQNPTRNITIGQLTQYLQTAQSPQYHVFNGLVNNLGSQGSGGYDFMEWTSNVTGPTQIPLIRTTDKLRLVYVSWVWMGETPISLQAGESVTFSIGTIGDNLKSEIVNYNENTTIFRIDSNDSGTFVSGQADVSAFNIDFVQNDNLAVVGEEAGTITPNSGELAISLKFVVMP
jgi:hypothetical protein